MRAINIKATFHEEEDPVSTTIELAERLNAVCEREGVLLMGVNFQEGGFTVKGAANARSGIEPEIPAKMFDDIAIIVRQTSAVKSSSVTAQ